ncbi:MAG: carboxypeptidase-like regulatory domain-containing protein [Balneolales bacterium]|nr:carboxypeptidase-like regulatory domain-containing protein [Balneolales bacterium]
MVSISDKKNSRFVLVLLISALFLGSESVAQSTIKGKVFEAGTAEPLTGVNVYLSGTTIGSSTGLEGEYEFTTSLTGNFELIVSFLGFKTQTKRLVLEGSEELTFNFILREDLMQLEEIQVTGERNQEWDRLFKDFKRFFLGEGELAEEVEIFNPEMIDFDVILREHVVVTSKEPLQMANHALGYNIEVEIDKIYFNPYNYTGYWNVYTSFKELESENLDQSRSWEENREKAYLGSSKHFFISLVYNDLRTDKFFIIPRSRAIERVEDEELIRMIFPTNWQDILNKYHVYRAADINFGIAHNPQLNRSGRPEPGTRFSSFDVKNYAGLVVVDNNGNIINSEEVVFLGPWSQDGFAKTLPLDYSTFVRIN